MPNTTCSIEGCVSRAHARSFWPKHYQRWRATGDPLVTVGFVPIECVTCGVETVPASGSQVRCADCAESVNKEHKRRYALDEENRAAKNAQSREVYASSPDVFAERRRRYWAERGDEMREYHRQWRNANIEKLKWQRREREYGLTQEQAEALVTAQGGGCGVCREPLSDLLAAHVDHCHETGRVRGILCPPCNKGLGHFGDDPERLRRAADYIDSAYATWCQ